MINVIGVYDDAGKARQVINELVKAGLEEDDIEVMADEQKRDEELEEHIRDFGLSKMHAHLYAEAVRHGKAVLNAHTADDDAQRILDILNANGARDIEETAEEFSGQHQESQGAQAGWSQAGQEAIPEIEEELEIGKKKILQGGVRLVTKVSEKPVKKTVELREEHIEVERHESDRELSPDDAKQYLEEETREFTETREVPEVEKKARETGRVEIKKQAKTHEETIEDTVRKTEVEVEQIKPEGKRKPKR